MGISNDRPQSDEGKSEMDLLRSGVEKAKSNLVAGRTETEPEPEEEAKPRSKKTVRRRKPKA